MSKNNAIQNRYDFTILFDVRNGNPNGDPDAGNMPRIDVDTNAGLITDVCIKRKIRNYISLNYGEKDGYDIYINRTGTLNSKDEEALEALKENKINKSEEEKYVIDFMCNKYFDVRTFGAVMTGFTKKEAKLSGNAGHLTGPVQLSFAQSVDPIFPQNVTITRCAITTEKDAQKKNNEMGNKWIVPYGLYRMDGYISANLAQKTGFNNDDIEILWNAIMNMFEDDRSAARGEMAVRKLFIFKHNSKCGNVPSHKLHEMISVKKKDTVDVPRSFDDYEISIPDKNEIPECVELEIKD